MCKYFEWIPARLVLYFLGLNGITVTFIMRLVINLTILAMVKEKPVEQDFNVTETVCYVKGNVTRVEPIDYGGKLDWSLNDQFYVLTSFYWTYLASQLVSGIVAQKFGSKVVFGWSLLISSTCTVCVPFTSNIHHVIVVILQCINGVAQGFTWPALYAAIAVWIPIHERSRFVTCFQGTLLGTMLANLIAGYVIAQFGWIYVFYCAGGLGFLSTFLWYLLMHDIPEQHPRISRRELQYIKDTREHNLHSQKTIPWASILTSIPVYAIGITSFGRLWMSTVMTMYGPLYLKTIIGLSVEMNGLLLGLSSLVAFLAAFIFSFISDKIVAHKLMPLVYNRKMFTGIGQVIPGIMGLAITYVNCNIPLIVTIWFLIQLFGTAGYPGGMTNIVDISPSYTGPVTSVIQSILLLPTIFSAIVVKTSLLKENTLETWQKIFQINSGVMIGTYIFYAIFASAKVQPWDIANDLSDCKTKEELLNDDKSELPNATSTNYTPE